MNNNIVQVKPVECRACSERARETPNMACCRCQDEDAFCNNDVAKVGFVSTKILWFTIFPLYTVQPPARLPIEDFPVRRPELGPGLTCQNSIACTLFDDCDEVIFPTSYPPGSGWLDCDVSLKISLRQDEGACRIGDNLIEDDISLRQAGRGEGCPRGQVSLHDSILV